MLNFMNITQSSEFETVAANIAGLAFPKTQFQLLYQKIGNNNLILTFKSKKHFSENFRVSFFPKVRTLIVSGYCQAGMFHLNYNPANNYEWFNGNGYKITSPCDMGEKLEFLAKKFYPFLEEFFLG